MFYVTISYIICIIYYQHTPRGGCHLYVWGERDSNPPTARPVRQFVFRRDLQSRAVISPYFKKLL